MFLLRDLRFVLCWLDLDLLHTQRIIYRLFYLEYPQLSEVSKSIHMDES